MANEIKINLFLAHLYFFLPKMAVLNQTLFFIISKTNEKGNFSTILAILAGKKNSEHSAATSAVVFWTDVGERLYLGIF